MRRTNETPGTEGGLGPAPPGTRRSYANQLRARLGLGPCTSRPLKVPPFEEVPSEPLVLAQLLEKLVAACPEVPSGNNGTFEVVRDFMGLWTAWTEHMSGATKRFAEAVRQASFATVNSTAETAWTFIAKKARILLRETLRDVDLSAPGGKLDCDLPLLVHAEEWDEEYARRAENPAYRAEINLLVITGEATKRALATISGSWRERYGAPMARMRNEAHLRCTSTLLKEVRTAVKRTGPAPRLNEATAAFTRDILAALKRLGVAWVSRSALLAAANLGDGGRNRQWLAALAKPDGPLESSKRGYRFRPT